MEMPPTTGLSLVPSLRLTSKKNINITAKTSTIEEFHMENHMFSHMVPEKTFQKNI